jgi:hypothetical protein
MTSPKAYLDKIGRSIWSYRKNIRETKQIYSLLRLTGGFEMVAQDSFKHYFTLNTKDNKHVWLQIEGLESVAHTQKAFGSPG